MLYLINTKNYIIPFTNLISTKVMIFFNFCLKYFSISLRTKIYFKLFRSSYVQANSIIYRFIYPNLSRLNNNRNYRSHYKMFKIYNIYIRPSNDGNFLVQLCWVITFLWDFTNWFGFLRSYPTIGSYLGRLFSHEQGWKVEEGLLHIRPLINPLCKQSQSLFNSAPLYTRCVSLNYACES